MDVLHSRENFFIPHHKHHRWQALPVLSPVGEIKISNECPMRQRRSSAILMEETVAANPK